MGWLQTDESLISVYFTDKCAECFHTASDHGAGGSSGAAEPAKEEAPRRTFKKASPKASPRKKSPSPVRRRKSPSPVRRRSPSPVKRREKSPEKKPEGGPPEISDTMKCVVVSGGSLTVETRPTPSVGKDQVLVRVRASGLNNADLLQAKGRYNPPAGASDILGLEVSGVVAKVGHAMRDYWGVGDRVCGLVAGGGYAEYCVVHGDSLIELPEKMSFEEGGGVPEAFLTAYQALFFLADLKNRVKDRRQNVLIWGASGGVGSAAVQLARHFVGDNTKVFGMAGSAEKCEYVKSLGAHVAINHRQDDLERIVERECDGKGIDVLIDLVGNFSKSLKVMAVDSVMVVLGFMSGSVASEVEMRDVLVKRITVKGSTLRARDDQYKGILTQSFVEDFGKQLERGTLKVTVDKTFTLEQAGDAHAYMSEGKHKVLNGFQLFVFFHDSPCFTFSSLSVFCRGKLLSPCKRTLLKVSMFL